MSHITENVSLKGINTFEVESYADQLAEVHSERALIEMLNLFNGQHPLILGGGSNILFKSERISRPILKISIKERRLVSEEDDEIIVRFGAGENWHDCVVWSLQNGYYGLENLSLIPGTVGAAPMQNIGAYGVEIEQVFHSLMAINIASKTPTLFMKEDCEFGYRESIFKKALKDKFVISSITLRLKKTPSLNYSYQSLSNELAKRKIENPSPQDISDAVIAVRSSKLPEVGKNWIWW